MMSLLRSLPMLIVIGVGLLSLVTCSRQTG